MAQILLAMRPAPALAESPRVVELFVMSRCPYGVTAELEILNAIESAKQPVDFRLYFIGRDRSPGGSLDSNTPGAGAGTGGGPRPATPRLKISLPGFDDARCHAGEEETGQGTAKNAPLDSFSSLHGPEEIVEDARQVVIARLWPDRLTSYLRHRAGNFEEDAGFIEAARSVGIDPDSLDSLARSRTGASWLRENLKTSIVRGVSASPTLYLDGVESREVLRSTPLAFVLAGGREEPDRVTLPECDDDLDCRQPGVCVKKKTGPPRCLQVDPIRVPVRVFVDSLCAACPDSFLVERTRDVFPGLLPRFIDVNTAEGRRSASRFGIRTTPSLVFEAPVATPHWQRILPILRPASGAWVMDADFLDSGSFPARHRTPGTIDIFVAGMHRDALRSPGAIQRLLRKAGRSASVRIHYVAKRDPVHPWAAIGTVVQEKGAHVRVEAAGQEPRFLSTRGPLEIEENRRQLCLLNRWPKVYDSYLERVLTASDTTGALPEPWSILTAMARVDTTLDLLALDKCVHDRSSAFDLANSASLAESLGITVTPSFLVNNRVRMTGLSLETLAGLIRELHLGLEVPDAGDLMRRRTSPPKKSADENQQPHEQN